LFISTFQSVSPLLTIGLLGFWIISRRILAENTLKFLSPLALDIALLMLIQPAYNIHADVHSSERRPTTGNRHPHRGGTRRRKPENRQPVHLHKLCGVAGFHTGDDVFIRPCF